LRIHSIGIRNYKSLRDVSIGDVPGISVLVGDNGSGKSTFIDVFGFLKDCLKDDVRIALGKRGGFG